MSDRLHLPDTKTNSWTPELHMLEQQHTRFFQESTAATLVQYGVSDEWWSDAMECHRYVRTTTPRRALRWTSDTFAAEMSHTPITHPRDEAKTHQCGINMQIVASWIFLC